MGYFMMVAMTSEEQQTQQEQQVPQILIVDDEAFNCTLLERVLGREYGVTSVYSGREALAALETNAFDVVLLDIMMPEIPGLEVLQSIRNTPEISDLPVILVSALSDIDDVVRGLQMGANDYLAKPVDIDVLGARVNTQVTLKRLMDERKQTIAQLQATQQMKDRLLRMASHDLKSPLTNIRMAEFVLREVVGDNQEGNEILDMVVSTVENMQNVISEFLDSAPLHDGKIDLKLKETAVEQVIVDVMQQYGPTATNKSIQLVTEALPGKVMADPARLEQVIGNLVSNAIKYSPKDSVVTVWSDFLGERVRINVADQGPGIPPTEQHLLFTEFGKLTPRPTAGESSTGLGLWSVKQLMSLHNGTVGVDCPPDGGSVFWIELPAVSP
jgi:signal transduction histidine kinase